MQDKRYIICGNAPTSGSEVLGISHASAHEQIAQLVRKGYLKKEARKTRSIVVIRRPEFCKRHLQVAMPLLRCKHLANK